MLQAFFLEVVIDNKINQYFNIDIDVSISIDYPSPSDTGIILVLEYHLYRY